jgi:uncharacterized domain HDIG
MNKETYRKIENYMLEMMGDAAHDSLHIYRVLHQSLFIAKAYNEVNRDVLIASCLLHDIGRAAQFQNPKLCHAVEGGKMAYTFIKEMGWNEILCSHIQDCITTHRFRTDSHPTTIEAKILFDSDKLDATGALGIARSLIYKGQVGEPLYIVDENSNIQDGNDSSAPESFFKEYHFKLIKLYNRFYTKEANAIAQRRKKHTTYFFDGLMEEVDISDLGELLSL